MVNPPHLNVDPKTLEKLNITVGYVPVNDCAPFAIAYEKGFFHKYGLNVTLSREASWANSREGIIFGCVDEVLKNINSSVSHIIKELFM